MRRRAGLLACLALLLAGCGDDDGGGGGPDATAYPFACTCDCLRCTRHDPTTAACLEMGRDTFPVAFCEVGDASAGGPCLEACGRFGSDCHTSNVRQASTTACP